MRKKQQNQRCGKWITARTNSPAKKENRSYPHSTSALLLKGTVAPSSPARRVATASDEESARTPGVARPTAGDSMQHRLASGKAPLKSNRQFRPMLLNMSCRRHEGLAVCYDLFADVGAKRQCAVRRTANSDWAMWCASKVSHNAGNLRFPEPFPCADIILSPREIILQLRIIQNYQPDYAISQGYHTYNQLALDLSVNPFVFYYRSESPQHFEYSV